MIYIDYFIMVILAISLGLNIYLAIYYLRLRHLLQVKKENLTTDAREILRDVLNGKALVQITRIEGENLLLWRGLR